MLKVYLQLIINEQSTIKDLFPILKALNSYSKTFFKDDFLAGLLVAILLVPQAIAYAYLAGMPPEYGLYAALVPCVIYSLMGTSPHLAVGPVAVSALLIIAGVSQLAEPFSVEYVQLVLMAGLGIGIMQLLFGLLRMGSIINLLSYPVITGFTSAASIIVIVNQFKDIFGLSIPNKEHLYETIVHIFNNINHIHLPTIALGGFSFILISIIRSLNRKLPYGLIVVCLGIIASYYLHFERSGIAVIGFVPSGLPSFSIPDFSGAKIVSLLPTIMIVTIIGTIESIGIGRAIESKHEYYVVKNNQELKALGSAKIFGAFFGALPSSGSFSRSALLSESKGKTTVASLLSVVFVIISLLFLTPLLFHLPKVILAVIIIFAVKNLFEYTLAKSLFKNDKKDFAVMLITFLVTIGVNIEIGILSGFLLSIGVFMSRSASPIKALKNFITFNKKGLVSNVDTTSSSISITLDGSMTFTNADYLKTVIIKELKPNIKSIDIDCRKLHDIDSVGHKTLNHLVNKYEKKEIDVVIRKLNNSLNL